jgi:hypothetical protein
MAVMAAGAMIGSLAMVGGTAGASVNTLYVSMTGSDTNSCTTPATACATINHALGVAVAGDTVKVGAGTYDQTVAITKPVRLEGAGATHTTINGAGIDPGGTLYGVVYVGTTGGAVSVSGFTITNPFPDAYTGGEPEVVALADQNAADSVVITQDLISEGAADSSAGTDFPIGIDTFLNAATTTITHNKISGTFQGALLEDNGPVSFSHNKVQHLIANTDGATVYPAEGIFFLSDTGGSLTGQDASRNTFSHYAGFGLIMEAGYNNGNCSSTPCNGSIAGTLSRNHLALGGASGAVGIDLQSQFNGNNLTATVSNNHGYVTSPSQGIDQAATNGATITVTGSGNSIVVHP